MRDLIRHPGHIVIIGFPLSWNDEKDCFLTFYEFITSDRLIKKCLWMRYGEFLTGHGKRKRGGIETWHHPVKVRSLFSAYKKMAHKLLI